MGQFQPKTFDFILKRMTNRVVARSSLNDLNDGSDTKQVLAAAAREDDDAHTQMVFLLDLFDLFKCNDEDLDERLKEFNPRIVEREQSRRATGFVVFARQTTLLTVPIAVGTQVTVPKSGSQPEIVFITTAPGSINNTFTTSAAVPVVAKLAGTSGNVAPGAISAFVSRPSGVLTVTNPSALTNGRDKESDDAVRRRAILHILGLARSHTLGLESAALTAEDTVTGQKVLFAHAITDPVNDGRSFIYVDDGTGTIEQTQSVVGGTVIASAVGGETFFFLPDSPIKIEEAFNLYVNAVLQVEGTDYVLNPATGQINMMPVPYPTGLTAADAVTADYVTWTGLIRLVQKIIYGDRADRANFPGYRADGILVRVLPPAIVQQVVTANVTVTQGFSQSDIATKVAAAISAYINGLGIGEDVILNEITERAMAVPGMYDVEITVPTENIVILDNQLARIIASNLVVT